MNHDLILGAQALGKDRVRHVAAAAGRRVECLDGSIWITQDGDRRDIVLGAGEAFDFDRANGFIGALADSHYLLLRPSTPCRIA